MYVSWKINKIDKNNNYFLKIYKQLKGEIYVKGFWLGNKAKDGIYHGLNMHRLHLDRDRRNALSSRYLRKKYNQLWAQAINEYQSKGAVDGSVHDRLVC